MDTDVVAGLEAGLRAVLVLSGVSTPAEASRLPYVPSRVVESVADLLDERPSPRSPETRRRTKFRTTDPRRMAAAR
jgi:hypothetical protein